MHVEEEAEVDALSLFDLFHRVLVIEEHCQKREKEDFEQLHFHLHYILYLVLISLTTPSFIMYVRKKRKLEEILYPL
jgi:hypothetical protein